MDSQPYGSTDANSQTRNGCAKRECGNHYSSMGAQANDLHETERQTDRERGRETETVRQRDRKRHRDTQRDREIMTSSEKRLNAEYKTAERFEGIVGLHVGERSNFATNVLNVQAEYLKQKMTDDQ